MLCGNISQVSATRKVLDAGFRFGGNSKDALDRYAELYIQTYKFYLKHLPILTATIHKLWHVRIKIYNS